MERAEKLVNRFNNNVSLLNRALREKYGVDLATPQEDIAHRQSQSELPIFDRKKRGSFSSSEAGQVKANPTCSARFVCSLDLSSVADGFLNGTGP